MAAEKKIDEFVFVLITGLLMIIAMLYTWGVEESGTTDTENGENVSISGLFSISGQAQDGSRNIQLGDFTVSYTSGKKILGERSNAVITKGLLEDKSIKISGNTDGSLSLVTDGYIIVDVLDTNSEGPLVVKVNNHEVYNQLAPVGRVTIEVDSDYIDEYNVLEISTAYTGWMFWKSSYYRLDNVQFGLDLFGVAEKRETFSVLEGEVINFKDAWIDGYVQDRGGDGNLMVKINGYEIYKARPLGNIKIGFDKLDVGLIRGLNTVSFSAERDTTYTVKYAGITLVHEEPVQTSKIITFKMDDFDVQNLEAGRTGEIKFRVRDLNYKGSLELKIKDALGVDHKLDIPSYAKDEESVVEFVAGDVDEGTNRLIFEATQDGWFAISNVEVDV